MERLTVSEIKELIIAGKEGNLSYLDAFGVTLHFNRSPIRELSPTEVAFWNTKSPKTAAPDDSIKALAGLGDLTEEEIKYYATPYFDQLQAEKEARAAHAAEGKLE